MTNAGVVKTKKKSKKKKADHEEKKLAPAAPVQAPAPEEKKLMPFEMRVIVRDIDNPDNYVECVMDTDDTIEALSGEFEWSSEFDRLTSFAARLFKDYDHEKEYINFYHNKSDGRFLEDAVLLSSLQTTAGARLVFAKRCKC